MLDGSDNLSLSIHGKLHQKRRYDIQHKGNQRNDTKRQDTPITTFCKMTEIIILGKLHKA
jgi:hypothetical protein